VSQVSSIHTHTHTYIYIYIYICRDIIKETRSVKKKLRIFFSNYIFLKRSRHFPWCFKIRWYLYSVIILECRINRSISREISRK